MRRSRTFVTFADRSPRQTASFGSEVSFVVHNKGNRGCLSHISKPSLAFGGGFRCARSKDTAKGRTCCGIYEQKSGPLAFCPPGDYEKNPPFSSTVIPFV
ncbi:hypothetical protein Bbelb_208950 [Branchiostoma belcheri]|nr:hypothetical protein Bbelb_208950 [Branchiostoma belcheri]